MEKEKKLERIMLYRNLFSHTLCPFQKFYYKDLLDEEIEYLKRQEVELTLEELSKYNGKGGGKAYVAVNGIVYDVSLSEPWGGGFHFGMEAGKDLTEEFNSCHQENTLSHLTKVGVLKK